MFKVGDRVRVARDFRTRDDLWDAEGVVFSLPGARSSWIGVILRHRIPGESQDREWYFDRWEERLIRLVSYPEQKCLDCQIASPHTEPNTNLGFRCVSCCALRELE